LQARKTKDFDQDLLTPERKHPPLDLLEQFEAPARLGSFTRAADELTVTQSAISQRVRKLEELLDLKMFERQHRSIELTPEGRELLNGVTCLTSAPMGPNSSI
jgi:LysR family transcriptional regulator, glycine cleavage system transcriptional activator